VTTEATPFLRLSGRNGHREVVEVLLANGAKADQADNGSKTNNNENLLENH